MHSFEVEVILEDKDKKTIEFIIIDPGFHKQSFGWKIILLATVLFWLSFHLCKPKSQNYLCDVHWLKFVKKWVEKIPNCCLHVKIFPIEIDVL